MLKINYKLLFHKFFNFTLLIKGFDGIIDILAGVILFIFGPHALTTIIPYLVRKELIEDPQDIIANYILHFSQNILPDTQTFFIFYLVFHGIIKIGLVIALLSKRDLFHKIAGNILFIFILYEVYRYTHTGSYILLGAILFDICTLFLIYHEYQKDLSKKDIFNKLGNTSSS